MFTSQVGAAARWDRWDFIALAIAVFTAAWVFALKLKTFYDLGYSGDIFVITQLARSWLEGRGLLQDNCFGIYLNIHTYFLLLPLGLIAKPFGAPGLLLVLAAVRRSDLLLGSSNSAPPGRRWACRRNRCRSAPCLAAFRRILPGGG
jgi:hypothetical protein